ncbi:hypothetical protein H5410_038204 [Solanum commersonii]|uniref:Retrovirus-related Pol polyprotein from transposon TNT 1-94-like beta-barrel domain-containing protein n=1 Tax=Solanum commersonii TaxID=4109 RepID=A0A9J5YCF6_SOLCO|nr:hypothetical protein H5410_038204 [Solanum commersonii]
MTHMEVAALIAGRNASSHKFRKDWNVQCEYCKKMGHAKVNCYKLIGYPPDFKFRKKVGNPNTPDPRGGDQRSQAHAGKTDDRAHSEIGQNRSACVHNCKDVTSQGKSISSEGENSGRYSDDWNKGTGSSSYSHSQYNQMMQHMDNQHHCNQFRRLVDKDTVGESSNMNRLSDSANMGGEFFTSHMTVGASGTPSAGNASVPSLNACRKEWIIDTGASNHMISHKEMLNTANKRIVIEDKKVYLPNGDTVDVSHIGIDEDATLPAPVDHPTQEPQVPINHEIPVVVPAPPDPIPSFGDIRHSTRPKKHPSWMNDFVVNATASTLYPLSQHLTVT